MRKFAPLLLTVAACCAAADPTVQFSTYLGGSDREYGAKTAVAADGSIYVAIVTGSPDLPVATDAAQKGLATGTCFGGDPEGGNFPRRCTDLYVARLSPSGEILRSTYLGGANDDLLVGIQLDQAGNVWIAGTTTSPDFPRAKVIGTPPTPFSGGFVAELSADLRTTLQSTVVIGAGPSAFTLDSAGAAYLAGRTGSILLPVLNPIQPARTAGATFADAFIVKLSATGSLVYATYFGGDNDTGIGGIAVDANGAAVITGTTQASDLPGGGIRYGKRSGVADVFVAKIAPDGRSTQWLRWVGGDGFDSQGSMAMDSAGAIYVGGTSSSSDFSGDDYSGEPAGSGVRGFVTKVSADGASASSRLFGYYVEAMTVDRAGSIWLSGTCCAGSLDASASALQIARNGFQTDTYLVQLAQTGPAVWASYIGGTDVDMGTSLSPTADGVVLAGLTQSFDFPTSHAVQRAYHQKPGVSPALADAFVMRFGSTVPPAPTIAPDGPRNAASYAAGEAAPGSIVALFGDDLSTVVRPATSLPLPVTLGDTTVTINGVAAPLYYVSPSQVNLQVPFETAVGTATVEVRRNGKISASAQLSIAPISAGLFVGSAGNALINAPSSPLQPGDWITLYATGLGAVTGPITSGGIPGNPPPQVTAPIGVTLGGIPLQVTWAGLAPGYAGLYQVNALLPADLGTGFQVLPLVVSAGGKSSNAGMVSVIGKRP